MQPWLVPCSVFLLSVFPFASSSFELTVLHTNDIHSRFEQINKYSGRCPEEDVAKGKCYGGFARLKYKIDEIRGKEPNVIFINAGDYYQGTIWYTIHKWRVIAHFGQKLGHTAMALGNHEFDDGIAGIVPFLENVTFPVLAANVDDSKEPEIQGKFKKSVVVEVAGRKVGIVGYLTTETMTIASPGELLIYDEVTGVKEEAERLKGEEVDIIMALGHAGYVKDQRIAKEVPEIDVVIGGHTNTFLYTGSPPDIEVPQGTYPTVVIQPSGRQVPVVQDYAYGKYLGYLKLVFDEQGEVTSWSGNPILLNSSVPQDPAIVQELQTWRKEVDEVARKEIGKTKVFLDGQRLSCRMKECNLGNLIADGMVFTNVKFADETEWSDVGIAIINGGGIRASIDETSNYGSITMEDVLTVLPFQNTIDLVEIKGRHVREMMEHSVARYDEQGLDPPGGFLQVSGILVTYDLSKDTGQRVTELLLRCNDCRVPHFERVKDDHVYKIAMTTFLANGGDGYRVIKDNKLKHHLSGVLDSDSLIEYIQAVEPVISGVEMRIQFQPKNSGFSIKLSLQAILLANMLIMVN